MVLNALKHTEDCLFYMAGMKEQSVFNFVAIPQAMAIATLELVFRNPAIFDKHIKLNKGDACQLMLESTQNLRVLCEVFRRYVRRIHKKNDPRSRHFLAISVQCAKTEQFIETLFPQQDPTKLAHDGKPGELAQQPNMQVSEAFFLLAAVLGVLFLVGGLMIGSAWLLGARFDQVFRDFDEKVKAGKSLVSSAATAIPSAIRDEL